MAIKIIFNSSLIQSGSGNFGCWFACILTQINSRVLIANATIDAKIDSHQGNQALTQMQKIVAKKNR